MPNDAVARVAAASGPPFGRDEPELLELRRDRSGSRPMPPPRPRPRGGPSRRPRRRRPPARAQRRTARRPSSVVLLPDVRARSLAHPSRSPRLGEPLERARRAPAISSSPPTGTLIATSSGSSANQPRSLTTSGLPSESVRIALPEVSPIVGARSEHDTRRRRRSATRAAPPRRTARGSRPRCRGRAARAGPRGRSPAPPRRRAAAARRGCVRRNSANARSSCGIRLFSFRCPKQPISGAPSTCAGSTSGAGHAGCAMRQSGPSYPCSRACVSA